MKSPESSDPPSRCGCSSPFPCVFFETFSEDVASGSLASHFETWTRNRLSVPPVRSFHCLAACNNTLPCIINPSLGQSEPSGACPSLDPSMILKVGRQSFRRVQVSPFLGRREPSAREVTGGITPERARATAKTPVLPGSTRGRARPLQPGEPQELWPSTSPISATFGGSLV